MSEYRTGSFVAGPQYGKYAGTWLFSELPWGVDNDLSNQCTERIGVGSDNPMVRFNFPKYNTLLFLNSLTSAPIEINEENIRKLPKSLGDKLFRVALGVNTISEKEQKDFLKLSKPDITEIK